MELHHEITGSGPPVVLIHEGIGDGRMWDAQWTSFADRHSLLRMDLPGFGRSPLDGPVVAPARDVAALVDEHDMRGAGVVGASFGGRVALELAIARPELVGALVLVAPGLSGYEDWSEAMEAYDEAETEALMRGDLDAAMELSLRMWVDGPRRAPADVDPEMRAAIGAMQRHAYELGVEYLEDFDEQPLVEDVRARLGEVAAPTLVVVGEEDVEDMHAIAAILVAEVPGARLETIPDTAHAPMMERPAEFDALVLPFLAEHLGG